MTVQIAFEGKDQQECITKMQEFLTTYHGASKTQTAGAGEGKPAPKRRTRAKAKPAEPEPDGSETPADPDAGYEKPAPKGKRGEKIDFDDITEAAGILVKACDNDMKKAQELVYSEFQVRKVSKLAVEDYPKAYRWMVKIAEQMIANKEKGEDDGDEDGGE